MLFLIMAPEALEKRKPLALIMNSAPVKPEGLISRLVVGPQLYLLETAGLSTGFELYRLFPFYIPPTTESGHDLAFSVFLMPRRLCLWVFPHVTMCGVP